MWHFNEDELRSWLSENLSFFAQCRIQQSGKYLGIHIGPGYQDKQWAPVADKLLVRAGEISHSPKGLMAKIQQFKYMERALSHFVRNL